MNAIAAFTVRSQDVLGLHFFSPANVMRLLEVVRGAKTSGAALATAMAPARQLGKTAVVSRVCHGFIANRIMDVRRLAAEHMSLQGNDVATIDAVLVEYGFPMGQFAMMDLIGLDVMGRDSGTRTLMGDFVNAGRLGQKSGDGYFDYDEKRKLRHSPVADHLIRTFAKEAEGLSQRRSHGKICSRACSTRSSTNRRCSSTRRSSSVPPTSMSR